MLGRNLKDRVVVITGAGGGLGRAYALLFAKYGARVVVNDLGTSLKGDAQAKASPADRVVEEIVSAGGVAVPNYESVVNGQEIIKTAIDTFGRIDILVNNAGILRDSSFLKMTRKDWDILHEVHTNGALSCTKAAWPYFVHQKFGRIIMTSSAAGIYGNFGQTNYSSAKASLIGFAMALSKSGAFHNILVNVIAPLAASRFTETILPQEILDALRPEYVAPVVLHLADPRCSENGGMFEIGGGFVAKVRWQRSKGVQILPSSVSNYTESFVSSIQNITDFSDGKSFYLTDRDNSCLGGAAGNSINVSGPKKSVGNGKVVLLNFIPESLFCVVSKFLSEHGFEVVVNIGPGVVSSEMDPQKMRGLMTFKHGPDQYESLFNEIIFKFGHIDIVINGYPQGPIGSIDTARLEDIIGGFALNGPVFELSKSFMPHFVKAKAGKFIQLLETDRFMGDENSVALSCLNHALLGFGRSLAIEGIKPRIQSNFLVLSSGLGKNGDSCPSKALALLLLTYICSSEGTGQLFEIRNSRINLIRYERSKGVRYNTSTPLLSDKVSETFNRVISFESDCDHPQTVHDSFSAIYNPQNKAVVGEAKGDSVSTFEYHPRDISLYNLGIGAKPSQLNRVFESSNDFSAYSCFAVIPALSCAFSVDIGKYLKNFDFTRLLHGEQNLEVVKHEALESQGTLHSVPKVIELQQKGDNVVMVIEVNTRSSPSGDLLFRNQITLLIKNCSISSEPIKRQEPVAGKILAMTKTPTRPADAVVSDRTSLGQAAIYRLSGDLNPLHISHDVARMAGFDRPILHGLCSFGFAYRHIVERFLGGDDKKVKSMSCRFVKHVFPGDTLETRCWKTEGSVPAIQFVVRVVERNCVVIGSGVVVLNNKATQSIQPVSQPNKNKLVGEIIKAWKNLSENDRAAMIRTTKGSFQFTVASDNGSLNFFFDLRTEQGNISEGSLEKADCKLAMKEDTFLKLLKGELKGQQAFMKGLVKISGQLMLSMKLDGIMKKLRQKTPSLAKP